jgi:hypothetical protein
MGNPAYSPRNLLADATAVLLTDGGPTFIDPAPGSRREYIFDAKPGTVCRWPRSGLTPFVQAEFPEFILPSCMALINHNCQGIVRLYRADTAFFAWTQVLSYTIQKRGASVFLQIPASTPTARHWALQMDDSGFDSVPYLGEWWLGELVVFPRNTAWGDARGKDFRTTTVEFESGDEDSYLISERQTFEGDLPDVLTPSEVQAYKNFYEATKGRANPFLFIPDSAASECYIAKNQSGGYAFRSSGVNKYTGGSLSIAEIPWAKPIIGG